jgi:hypothetical protein
MIIRKSFSQFIKEAVVPPQPKPAPSLSDLRSAAAKATMAGPSKEAQSLMSTRTKNILGPEKLSAGIKAQQGVETMRSSIPSPSSTPSVQSKDVATLGKGFQSLTQNPNAVKPSTTVPAKPTSSTPVPTSTTPAPTAPAQPKPGLSDAEKKRIDDFRALGPLQKLQQKSQLEKELSTLTPEQRQQVMDYYNR